MASRDMIVWSRYNDWSALVVASDDELSRCETMLAHLRAYQMWSFGAGRAEDSDMLSRGLTHSKELPAWVEPAAYPEAL